MIIRRASDLDVLLVCRSLRALNREECEALRGPTAPDALAREFNTLFAAIGNFRHVFLGENRAPVAVLALFNIPGMPGDCGIHLIATEQWPSIAFVAYRFMRASVVPIFFPLNGVRSVATDVLDRGVAARKWLHRSGFDDEGPPRPLGRHGEMFQRVRWRAVDAPGADLGSASLQQGRTAHV
jgi:hypothetical protein